MPRVVSRNLYTVVSPGELWNTYKNDLWRCGRPKHPALHKLRLGKDLYFAMDPFVPDNALILPNEKYGISFSDSIEKLRSQPISGVAWKLELGKHLPEGLCFNYRDKDHPLLNVSRIMPANELVSLLGELSTIMENTSQRV